MQQSSKHRTLVLTVFGLSALSGCKTVSPGSSAQLKILNGDPIANANVAYKSLVAVGPNPAGPACSGTLIGRRVVLTAAHCAPEYGKLYVRFGAMDQSGEQVVASSDIIVNPQYLPPGSLLRPSPYDLAVVILSKDAPEVYQPAPILDPQSSAYSQGTYELSGYGLTAANSYPTVPQVIERKALKIIDTPTQPSLLYFPPNPKGVCSGDSGGPAFLLPDGILAGAASFSSYCSIGEGVYTYLPKFASWIKTTADAKLGGASGVAYKMASRAADAQPGVDQIAWRHIQLACGYAMDDFKPYFSVSIEALRARRAHFVLAGLSTTGDVTANGDLYGALPDDPDSGTQFSKEQENWDFVTDDARDLWNLTRSQDGSYLNLSHKYLKDVEISTDLYRCHSND